MSREFEDQLEELMQIHKGLARTSKMDNSIVLSGPLPFEASADGFQAITDSFEIEMDIPRIFPDMLPRVRETGGKIDQAYEHVYDDGTLCLAVPVEERRVFFEQPSLLGFVNRLIIPYFYGYCHWKKYGEHPFSEQEHGGAGIMRHYIDMLKLASEIEALSIVCFLYEHGYRGHHPCPCGSGLSVRKCHGPMLRDLNQYHTAQTLRHDFFAVFDICFKKYEAGQIAFPASLKRQILRILDNTKRHAGK